MVYRFTDCNPYLEPRVIWLVFERTTVVSFCMQISPILQDQLTKVTLGYSNVDISLWEPSRLVSISECHFVGLSLVKKPFWIAHRSGGQSRVWRGLVMKNFPVINEISQRTNASFAKFLETLQKQLTTLTQHCACTRIQKNSTANQQHCWMRRGSSLNFNLVVCDFSFRLQVVV